MLVQEHNINNGTIYQVRYEIFLPTSADNAAFILDPSSHIEQKGWIKLTGDDLISLRSIDEPPFQKSDGSPQYLSGSQYTSYDSGFVVTGVENIGLVVAGFGGIDRTMELRGSEIDGMSFVERLQYVGMSIAGTSKDIDAVIESFGPTPMPVGKQFWQYTEADYQHMQDNLSSVTK